MSAIKLPNLRAKQQNSDPWRQGELFEITITDLLDTGDGVGRYNERVVFVPNTAPGDRVIVRLMHVKPKYAHARLMEIVTPADSRILPSCIVADKCGGCQWQHIDYPSQLAAKRQQVIQALSRIGGFESPPVEPIVLTDQPLAYRNKATYPLGISTANYGVQAGYYQKGSHQLINLNQCPVQDSRLNPLLAQVKQDIQNRGWRIYDETRHQGQVRHLGLRIGRRTGEMLLTLVVTDWNLKEITDQAEEWLDHYPQLMGVSLNRNSAQTNAIFGTETRCIAGIPYLKEIFADLEFHVLPDTFFQVNTEVAEALLQSIQAQLNLQGSEILLDAYCGIGTLSLPLASQVRQVIGMEVQPEAVAQAIDNAQCNSINNATFYTGNVEELLPTLDIYPDIVLLDPPRKGCDRAVIDALLKALPERIVYVSCKPATLARDLKLLCQTGQYRLVKVQSADFFPQTSHIECVAHLVLSPTV